MYLSSLAHFLEIRVLTRFYSLAVDNTYNKEAEKENLVDESISSNTYSSIKIKETTSRNIPAQPQR